MRFKELWLNILRSGAVIGVIMAVSHIFEHYVLVFADTDIITATLAAYAEGAVVFVLYVWLLYRDTRGVARVWKPNVEMADGSYRRIEFGYGRALSFVLLVSMLAGVIVGFAHTLFVDYMGFDVYMRGFADRIAEIKTMPSMMQGNAELLDSVVESLESAEQPSILSNIVSYVNQYMFMGLVPGLVIAALARRGVRPNNDVM